ncbi:thiazolylpeptide-type bacteriocin [Pseudonocardia sp.]|uniref:thiazolylpeptide-type bacteriocin n=1 Tax=Pseudonocardia sp. TaxID=60912 RepID=UPI0034133349
MAFVLSREILELESETFEITDLADFTDDLAGSTSCCSCSCSSCCATSSCSCSSTTSCSCSAISSSSS